MIIMNEACTVNVYSHQLVPIIMVVNMTPPFGASLTFVNYDPRVVSYTPNIFYMTGGKCLFISNE